MKIKGKQTNYIDVEIDKSDLIREVIILISKEFEIGGCFLSSDKKSVRRNDEYYHGSWDDHEVRKASKRDILGFEIVNELEHLRKQI